MKFEIGVIQKRSKPAFPMPGTVAASDQFVRRIAERYLANELTVSRAELALAYQAPGEVNYFQDAHLNVSPQVSFHDHYSFAPVQRERVAHRMREEARLFERLFSRQERVASFATVAPQGAVPNRTRPLPGFSTARPEQVKRIVRAGSPEGPTGGAATAASLQVPDSGTGWGTPVSLPPAPQPFTLPSADVKRVTEQVIREIDHRIIARRERTGRR